MSNNRNKSPSTDQEKKLTVNRFEKPEKNVIIERFHKLQPKVAFVVQSMTAGSFHMTKRLTLALLYSKGSKC